MEKCNRKEKGKCLLKFRWNVISKQPKSCGILPNWHFMICKGWVFTSDGVVVGVVIRSVERYNLMEIKPTESEVEHQF